MLISRVLVLAAVFLLAGCATPGKNDDKPGWMKPIATRDTQHQLEFSYMSGEEAVMEQSAAWYCKDKSWGSKAKYTDDGLCVSIDRRRAMECIGTAVCDACRMWMQCSNE